MERKQQVGDCWVVLYSFHIVNRGFEKILVLDSMLGWADPPMVLCMIFALFFGRDGFRSMVLDAMVFRSMVLDASASINMYCNIERNIMKNQGGTPSFGIP